MGTSEEAGTEINVGQTERTLSLLAGGGLVIYGLTRRGGAGWAAILAGAGLVHRGVTGHCYGYDALGKKNFKAHVGGEGQLSRKIPGHGGILVEKHLTINRPAEELYRFWRDLENLPQVMSHLQSVQVIDQTTSHWVAAAPAGTAVSWDAKIIRDNPNELIAWRSQEGSTVENSGSVQFKAAPHGRGTEVRVIFEYKPPAGKLGAAVAKMFGEEPHQQVDADLRRFKQLMETGEIATVDGQPHG